MLTGTSVSATSSSCPSLRRTVVSTWPPDSRELGVQAQRLRQRAPEHALRGPAEQLLGGAAPARHRALTISEHEARVDELAQQLLNDLRGGGL